jgi:HK97 family phage major capsid protein
MEIKELHETMLKAIADLHKAVDTKAEAGRAEQKQLIDRINAEVNAKVDAIEVKLKRTAFTPASNLPEEKAMNVKKAAKLFIKKVAGIRLSDEEGKFLIEQSDYTPEQQKALSLGDDTAAGYLAPKEYVNQIIKASIPFSPIRQLATVRQTANKAIMIPRRTTPLAASWVGQGATGSEDTALKYGLEEITTHKLFAYKTIEIEMLQDSAFDLEAEFNMECSEQFGIAEGTAFVSGTSVNQPEGLLSNAAVLASYIVSGAASSIIGDGLINQAYALKSAYAVNATWVMRRATVGAVRQLKDPVTGRYLWEPALNLGQPSTLLGYPLVEAPDMPLSTTGSNYPVLFGDFRRAYMVVDRISINVLRDPYSQADSGVVRFVATKRVGGQVILPEAVNVMKVST